MRLFVALDLPEAVRTALAAWGAEAVEGASAGADLPKPPGAATFPTTALTLGGSYEPLARRPPL